MYRGSSRIRENAPLEILNGKIMKITLLGRGLIRRQGHILDETRVAGHRGKQHSQKENKALQRIISRLAPHAWCHPSTKDGNRDMRKQPIRSEVT